MTGPRATARPPTLAHMAIALARSFGSVNTLVRIDRVAGMISAPPMPMTARAAMSIDAESTCMANDRAGAEDDEAGAEGAAAAEAVAEGAGGQQQPGEDEDVAVDDPLQVAAAGLRGPSPGSAGRR